MGVSPVRPSGTGVSPVEGLTPRRDCIGRKGDRKEASGWIRIGLGNPGSSGNENMVKFGLEG